MAGLRGVLALAVLAACGLAVAGCAAAPQAGASTGSVVPTAATLPRGEPYKGSIGPAEPPVQTAADAARGGAVDRAPTGSFDKAPKDSLADRDYSATRLDTARALVMLNAYRKEQGLPPLRLDPVLTRAAEAHSADLSKWDRISHYGSDGSNPWDRVKRAGYNARLAAENVGSGQVSFEEVFKGWQDSPGHNKNLLQPDAEHVGLALVVDPRTEFKTFWTLVIGARFGAEPAKPGPAVASAASVPAAGAAAAPKGARERPVRVAAADSGRSSAAAAPAEDARLLGTLTWPVGGGSIVNTFGPRPDGTHSDGIDIAVPPGTDVVSAHDGVVAYSGSEVKSYGNLILVRGDTGLVTAYAHNDKLLVKRGDTVKRGQVIAKSGASGTVEQPRLHFEVRVAARPVDPVKYLAAR